MNPHSSDSTVTIETPSAESCPQQLQAPPRAHRWAGQPRPYEHDMEGVMSLVISRIYSSPEVVFRELLQNAADGHTARRQLEPDHRGWIEIEVLPATEGRQVVTVSDNGSGIPAEEIETSLGTIAYSRKRLERGEGVIGCMGIGLLSCFWLAKSVTIISRHLGADAVPFRWIGHRDGRWEAAEFGGDLQPGTRVSFVVEPETAGLLKPENIRRMARQYGEFLPDRITVRTPGAEEVVTRAPFWEGESSEDDLLALGRDLLMGEALGAFRFSCPEIAGEGVGFISDHPAAPGSEPDHRLYVRRMFVSRRARHLSPPALPFVRCVLNAGALEVNAGREDLHGGDAALAGVRAAVQEALVRHLTGLESTAPWQLRRILAAHQECLVAEAERNGAFAGLMRRHYPLSTSLGVLTPDEALKRHGKIFYVTDDTDYLRAEIKAGQEGVCLAQGHYLIQGRLLRLLEGQLGKGLVERVSAAEFLGRFRADEAALGERELRLLAHVRAELQTERCAASLEEADDPYAPATLILDEMDSINRQLGGEGGEGEGAPVAKRLVLNRSHQVVESLLETADLPSDLARAWIRVLYHGALLGARECPTNGENRRHSRALGLILRAGLDLNL